MTRRQFLQLAAALSALAAAGGLSRRTRGGPAPATRPATGPARPKLPPGVVPLLVNRLPDPGPLRLDLSEYDADGGGLVLGRDGSGAVRRAWVVVPGPPGAAKAKRAGA